MRLWRCSMLVLVGCAAPPARMRPDVETLSGRTLVYVVANVRLPDYGGATSDSPATAPGYNADGLFSGRIDGDESHGCRAVDARSSVDPTQNCPLADLDVATRRCRTNTGCLGPVNCVGGVDNAASLVVAAFAWATASSYSPADVAANYSAAAASYVFRFTGVDSLDDDPRVVLKIYRAIPRFGANCLGIELNRRYALWSDSMEQGEVELPTFAPIEGRITGGRFVASGEGSWEIPFYFESGARRTPHLDFERVRLSVSLTETHGRDGSVGGLISRQRFTELLRPYIDSNERRIHWWAAADLRQSEASPAAFECSELDGSVGTHASFGFTFELVRAQLDGGSLALPPLGACGRW